MSAFDLRLQALVRPLLAGLGLLRETSAGVSSVAQGEEPQSEDPPAVEPPEELPDTFCIHPWTRLRVEPRAAGVCCAFRGGVISRNGSPLLPDQHPLEEIWNSDQMRAIRQDMVEGRKIAGCEECYQNEALGGTSMRIRDNQSWQAGWLNEEFTEIAALKSAAVSSDFRVAPPISIEVDTGSLCNLKCRMCHGGVSSRIASDPVHGTWSRDSFSGGPYHDERLTPRLPDVIRFSKRSFINDVPSYVDHVKRIYFIGGEPTLVEEIGDVLQQLIDSGKSKQIELALVSNGSETGSWLSLTKHFKKLDLSISMDGFGEVYDYIRYPSLWNNLVKNISVFQSMPHANVGASVTLQANNMLSVTDLFRYLDGIKVGFYCYPIYMPRHLTVWAMPKLVRQIAASRLREYADTDCLPQHRDTIEGLAKQVEPGEDAYDAELLRQFMVFTNDLDVSRGQSVSDADPELVGLLADEGFPWVEDTLHAGQQFPSRQ